MGYCLTTVKQSQGFSVAKHHCLANNNSQLNLFVWDPTESVATRPLFMLSNPGSYKFFYTFDGNKNVSELVHFETRNGIAAHYDYAPFGAVTRAVNTSTISARNFYLENPFRFSSEYHDDTLGLVYYNYRHYNPVDGCWYGRDLLGEFVTLNLFNFAENNPFTKMDNLGLLTVGDCETSGGEFSLPIQLPMGGSGLGDMTFDLMLSTEVEQCITCCPTSQTGYAKTIETTHQTHSGMTVTFTGHAVLWGIKVEFPGSFSYSMTGGTTTFYDGCSKKTTTTGCNTISVSGSFGICVKPIPIMSLCLNASGDYSTTTCGKEPTTERNFTITTSLCYNFGHFLPFTKAVSGCMSAAVFP